MRIAVLDRKKCVRGKSCSYECIKFCPGVRMGQETIIKGEDGYPEISEELCSGCGICTKKCPYSAITIINLPEELGNPMHQYGKNGFRVFGLPVPKEGVVGLIGSNATGKTTLVKMLAGQLVPNLGGENKDWHKVIELHRGNEIQTHLEALAEGGTHISAKPQNVDLIPKAFPGTVSELLEKESASFDLSRLGISHLADRNLDEVSGGELQRIAIAVALGRDADMYFFDEPTTYLDVKQRLRVAKLIRGLAETKKVLVVEHDLAVLDYLSDYVHVLYGKPGAYGIVSTLKSVRVGINEFLDGYLRAENMRFRKEGIKFLVKPPATEWEGRDYQEYPAFTKKYASFSLDAEGGVLRQGEVIGILGPNAIGKSTFMKVLAGVEKGEPSLDWSLAISYKPQYISSDFEGTVQELIGREEINREVFDTYLKPEVKDLYSKRVKELSGGEMQRVGIVLALARDCELCLLDEPSAFLDVEQRIKFADIIRKVTEKQEITTMVIDHDITLQDYVSDRLMVFEGEASKTGKARAAEAMHSGMNRFLEGMAITYRRDPDSGRPRANKPDSQKDSEQKKTGEYYYAVEE
ncbi:MAG: ribosome biogenesis/translation initiation ATPase RLI [Candidatus Diapherotrites archaeon]|nr:ribosome biogenesis/translation initiation ATPase RLI [Candidatus Diapherotrites archaeon]